MHSTITDVRTSLERFAQSFEPATLTGAQAVCLLGDLATLRRLTDGLTAKAARRVDETKAHERRGDRDAANTCAKLLGETVGEARKLIETAQKLEANGAVDAAVRAGKLTARQAGMIADASRDDPAAAGALIETAPDGMTKLKEACLAARAAWESEEARGARHHRGRGLRMWADADGMLRGAFGLAPEIGGQIKTFIDDAVRERFRFQRKLGVHEPLEAYAADALCEALIPGVTGAAATAYRHAHAQPADAMGDATSSTATPDDTSDRSDAPDAPGSPARGAASKVIRRPSLNTHIVIDFDALVRGNAMPGERCEIPGVGPVNAEWVRSILGDSFVTAVIKKGIDITTVAHFGRHINAALRTALLVQGAECIVEGCGFRGYLEIDHHHEHAKRGPTALCNLGPMRWICHHRKSRGWTLGPPDPTTAKRRLAPPPSRAGPDAS